MSAAPVRIPDSKVHKCRQCGKIFVSAEKLDLHSDRAHNSHDGGTHYHVCETCGELFRSRGELHDHGLTHVNQEQSSYQCGHCGKMFSSQRNLRDHEQTHSGAKQFACGECGMKFTKRNNLKTHRKRLHYNKDQR